MSEKQFAYVDDEGDLIVVDEYENKVTVALERVKTPADIVHQLWNLTTKNSYQSEALLKAIEIMSKKIGYDAATGGDFVGNG
ncbi:hypothetical protein [Citrobacter freundii]|uniref:Uncharacterized protein n=1 Tax=Citrobacter freundii TaxID=546 RepID=A0AAN4JDS6_CITFR|nr:hypothetical protein [Citrobacter freundii]EJT4817565.1 hypothetical protein [Citrobacter freundii]EKV1387318.1 hypothetical protein [Citrobacter freundii]EKW2110443.1 hypothetical protein [Citrobacter freundii]MBM7189183.1 hypothetical protein [Citrobacter freundii]MBM7250093.1 hypothetical protein [Citrobacter freundii]